MIRSKKGAELSMNVIIIAILAILVLVIVAAVFTGSFSKLMNTLFNVGPDSLSTATQVCQSKCDEAQIFSTTEQKQNSQYCRQTWKVDSDADGKVDTDASGDAVSYHCWESPISVACSSVTCPYE
jgi:flagellar basal body-associated protein FliL